MNAGTFRRLLALLLLAAGLSAASAPSLECGSSQVLGRTDYDAFGVLIDRTGSTDNSFLYCGERWDANLGFYYLRARYMNPGTGRFWTMDSFEGSQFDPRSLHLYLYVNGNPVNGHDPSGHMTLIGGIVIVAIVIAFLGCVFWGLSSMQGDANTATNATPLTARQLERVKALLGASPIRGDSTCGDVIGELNQGGGYIIKRSEDLRSYGGYVRNTRTALVQGCILDEGTEHPLSEDGKLTSAQWRLVAVILCEYSHHLNKGEAEAEVDWVRLRQKILDMEEVPEEAKRWMQGAIHGGN